MGLVDGGAWGSTHNTSMQGLAKIGQARLGSVILSR
jgi:hypothetical protein